jgi:hypothetical protein
MLGIRTIIMVEFSVEEKFIIDQLKENGGELDYKELQTLCQEEFEGVRLILKKLKEKQIVRYEGVIPSYSAKIKLNEVL